MLLLRLWWRRLRLRWQLLMMMVLLTRIIRKRNPMRRNSLVTWITARSQAPHAFRKAILHVVYSAQPGRPPAKS